MPGLPLEGWLFQYTEFNGTLHTVVNEGLMGHDIFKPSKIIITSTDSKQSMVWIGRYNNIEVKKITQFDNEKMYFSTSVTIKNIGSTTISDFFCKFQYINIYLFY